MNWTFIDRQIIAEHIAENGVMQGKDLRAALGWRARRFLDAVYASYDRWFMLTDSGWELTSRGRDLLRVSRRFSISTTAHLIARLFCDVARGLASLIHTLFPSRWVTPCFKYQCSYLKTVTNLS